MPPEPEGTRTGQHRPTGDGPLESGAGTLRAACPTLGRQERHITGGAERCPAVNHVSSITSRKAVVFCQLNVPGSTTTGAEAGVDMTPSPQEPQAGPQAGSAIGTPKAGWQGC